MHGVPEIGHMRYLCVSTLSNAILRPSFRRTPGQWALASCLQLHSLFSGACGLWALSDHLSGPCRVLPAGLFTDPKPHGGMNGELRPKLPEPLCRGVFLGSEIDTRSPRKCGGEMCSEGRLPGSTNYCLWNLAKLSPPPKKKSSFLLCKIFNKMSTSQGCEGQRRNSHRAESLAHSLQMVAVANF